jgi:hypothetical protein
MIPLRTALDETERLITAFEEAYANIAKVEGEHVELQNEIERCNCEEDQILADCKGDIGQNTEALTRVVCRRRVLQARDKNAPELAWTEAAQAGNEALTAYNALAARWWEQARERNPDKQPNDVFSLVGGWFDHGVHGWQSSQDRIFRRRMAIQQFQQLRDRFTRLAAALKEFEPKAEEAPKSLARSSK